MTAPELEPLPEGVLETLRKVSTSTIATQLYKRGFRQPQLLGVTPLSEVVESFCGARRFQRLAASYWRLSACRARARRAFSAR